MQNIQELEELISKIASWQHNNISPSNRYIFSI